MIAEAFILYLTFAASNVVKQFSVGCPDMACVERLRAEARSSTTLTRLQVFTKDNFALLPEGKQPMWCPIIDEQYQ